LYRIIKKKNLTKEVVSFDVVAPVIAAKARAGQFVVIRAFENGERIPLTIADNDTESGTITLVNLKVGKTTFKLSELQVGDSIIDVVGPLGTPSEIDKFGTVVFVGGGSWDCTYLSYYQGIKRSRKLYCDHNRCKEQKRFDFC
jgi:ferredoxin--NADP+ reductase